MVKLPKLLENNRPDPITWPNTGIGRINPDGTEGSCTACHGRHEFSAAQARTPDTCGKCHMGPDHPQIEIYNESKHGIAYHANVDKMNLKNEKWVVGEDYSAAPTCATCHMSGLNGRKTTHNPSDRLSEYLADPITKERPNAAAASASPFVRNRPAMIRSIALPFHAAALHQPGKEFQMLVDRDNSTVTDGRPLRRNPLFATRHMGARISDRRGGDGMGACHFSRIGSFSVCCHR
jgi:hypothetical protein